MLLFLIKKEPFKVGARVAVLVSRKRRICFHLRPPLPQIVFIFPGILWRPKSEKTTMPDASSSSSSSFAFITGARLMRMRTRREFQLAPKKEEGEGEETRSLENMRFMEKKISLEIWETERRRKTRRERERKREHSERLETYFLPPSREERDRFIKPRADGGAASSSSSLPHY